ncbi:STAS domain-containing protein [Dyella choica]|uniref:STAS domain-containing protein n=1 Tax=Dyella choica TaxID=1927959 RepID=A0A3S0RJT9_9GAMM|nr:STAS domain-containing protein [Dyella choica]RUL74426.1 STAS domain-containing protein [Dyella choica]
MAPVKAGEFRVTAEGPGTVSVAGTLNFATAANALVAMRDAFASSDRNTLDLAGVDSCDSAGLACVLAALSEADQGGRRVAVRHVPAGMTALAQVCGVEPLLR